VSRLSRRRGDDEGLTLVELLVVVMLLSIVSTVLTSSMIGALHAARKQDDQTRTLVEAKVAMERITREIRGANALTACAPRSMSFTMTRDNVRTAITYRVSAASATTSEILQDKTVTNLATGITQTSQTRVLGGLAIGRADAVFTYNDANGTPLAPQTATPETYNPGAAKTIGLRVLMRRINGAPSIQLYQLVSLRNFEV
jgi:prepilin-type N-terminal cleavage/methylation domain-containing protein